MKNYKIALVGCGAISTSHISAILSTGNTPYALCDIDKSAAEALCEKYHLENAEIYTDFSEMLDRVNPDIVHICTPHYLHAPMCIEALGRNINVICEKPICISLEEIDLIKNAVDNSKAQLGVCFQNRYEPAYLRLREICRDNLAAASGFVVWKRDETYYNSAEWRGTWKYEGGGVMINQAIHTLDMLVLLCGMPESVIAHTSTDVLGDVIEVEDTASARFKCANGNVFHIYATNSALSTAPAKIDAKLKNGRMVSATSSMVVYGKEIDFVKQKAANADKAVWGDGHSMLVTHFYNCIESGEHFPIDIDEASKAIRLIMAMYKSNGKEVKII